VVQDLKFAFRSAVAQRGFFLAVVATLALGIGINTTVFTLVNAVLFKDLPFENGDRVVAIGTRRLDSTASMDVSYPELLDYRSQTTSFERIEAAFVDGRTLSEPSHPADEYRVASITSGLLAMIGVEPVVGRAFGPDDERPGAPLVVLIGDHVWRSRYDQAPDIVGREVRLGETPATIVGVLPPGVQFPNYEDLWVPLQPTPEQRDGRGARFLLVSGLLRPDVTREAAQADLDVVAARLATSYADTNANVGARVETFNERFNGGQVRVVFLVMLAAVWFVLLIACANVANMLLGRSVARRHEMAIRLAIGATRVQLVRQLLVESLVLALAGGVLGLGLAVAGVTAFDRSVQDVGKPSWILFTVDWTVVGYFSAMCIVTAVIFGLVPALRSSRRGLSGSLLAEGRGSTAGTSRLSAVLVAVQVALAVVLVAGAGLLLRSFQVKQAINTWIPADQVFTARLSLPPDRYPTPDARQQFFERVRARLAVEPGVASAGWVSNLPGVGASLRGVEVEGAVPAVDGNRPRVPVTFASPEFFTTIDLTVLRGRGFDDRDGASAPRVAVVTETFASQFWPNVTPIDRRFRLAGALTDDDTQQWITVIGVTPEVVQANSAAAADPGVFLPFVQYESSSLVLAVRAAPGAAVTASDVARAVQSLDENLALIDAGTFAERLARTRWVYVVFGTVFSIFAAAALVMAGIGLYAVIAHATSRRTREIGIRMALGASPRRILAMIVRQGSIQFAAGLLLGLGGAYMATQSMRVLLFGVGARDPIVFLSTAGLLLTVGAIACWLPARRAAALAPVRALAENRDLG